MSTPFTELHAVLRALLGDRQVHGNWNYSTDTFDATLRAVFLLGRTPAGYALNNANPAAANGVTPTLPTGDAYALVAMEAALMIITSEDGAMTFQTRSLTVRDGGERRKGLIQELQQRIYDARDGDALFATYQSLIVFLQTTNGNFGSVPGATTGAVVTDRLGDVVF